ncbi:hypothetical protein SAY87_005691 [Trapa incisa]|uniref:GOST seven transmembrane domain-containing protein n=1 Tax=Trapa incisa TaxID=236973 RepID=A0AAN7K394_9MYRT|nr:hypothetical protein SAY87_005691 [Trapa incisa]
MPRLRGSPLTALLPLLLLAWAVAVCECSIHGYRGERFVSRGNAFIVHGGSEGIVAPNSDKKESSFIWFDRVAFLRPKGNANFSSGSIQAVVFDVEDRETIGGSAYGGQREVCCTADLAKLGVCTQGQIIRRPSSKDPDWPRVFGVSFHKNKVAARLSTTKIPITRTGMYNLYFIHCDPNIRDLALVGKTVWKNPGGYLPGRMAPLMNFYGFMSLAFVVLAVFWFSQYARFWNEILQLQNCISLVVILGMFEMVIWYFDYAAFNLTGVRPTWITVWAVTFGTVKRTVARLIILIVAMGYGVVRPTLGGLTSKVVMVGLTFLLASEALELVENVGTVNDVSGKARLFLVLPVAFLDAFFILWIFTSLNSTLNKLQVKRMTVKLDIYRKFTNALAVAVILSVFWICYELYFKANDVYNERWQNAWIIPAFWQVLSFSLLCIICVLWAPSQNSMRYAYSEEAGEEFDKDETSLTQIKPKPFSTDDDEARALKGSDGESENEVEEDKTE